MQSKSPLLPHSIGGLGCVFGEIANAPAREADGVAASSSLFGHEKPWAFPLLSQLIVGFLDGIIQMFGLQMLVALRGPCTGVPHQFG